MALNVWTVSSGISLGTFPEELTLTVALPVHNTTGITFSVISGSLPGGVRINGTSIAGNPYIVANNTTHSFCIRATDGVQISDRSFFLTITGNNQPEFVTAPGDLPIGPSQQFYVLDSSYVNYQIEAFDLDTAVGQTLTYFIASNDGALPAGLTLSPSGVISGFIEPTLKITPEDGDGTYDNSYFDAVAYDFANKPTDGFDSYKYDDVFYDYNLSAAPPTSLNANYQFRVTLTDGVSYAQRIFKIFVVGNDQFRADNTAFNGVADDFTSDATYLRAPVWISNSNLGLFRANNYLTIPLALYDTTAVIFRLETTNAEVYAVSYRVDYPDNTKGGNSLTVGNVKGTITSGQYLTFDNYLDGASGTVYEIESVTTLVNGQYRITLYTNLELDIPNGIPFYIGSLSELPVGAKFDIESGSVYGRLPYQPAVTENYKFTVTATRLGDTIDEYLYASKTFTLSVIGDVDSVITWNSNSPANLGIIPANYVCTLAVSATTTVPNAVVIYELVGGSLPPGLSLNLDGEIIGTTNQYKNTATGELGLTTFDMGAMTFDGNSTLIDRVFVASIKARDQFNYSAITRDFTIIVSTPNNVAYSNIITKPYLKSAQRNAFKAFITDDTIFTPSSIYRPNDSNFGVQSDLSMLVYAGIQTQDAAAYIGAIGLNVKQKRFQFDSVKTAQAIDPNTGNVVYEVVYVQMVDPMEPDGKHLPLKVTSDGFDSDNITVDNSINFFQQNSADLNANAPQSLRDLPMVTVDSTGYEVSNPDPDTFFPNSITLWQERLSVVGESESNYLPLWMRSIPSGSKAQLGYVLSVPLCFCKPGTSSKILTNIEFSGFEFNAIDYTVDRFIIDAVTGYLGDKYLVFRNDRITV